MFDFSAGRGQRTESFRFRLLEGASLRPLGEIHPVQDSVPSLSHNAAGNSVTRTISIALGEADSERINFTSDRVEVDAVIGGDTFRLGHYLFSDNVHQDFWDGSATAVKSLESAELADQMTIVDTELETAFTAVNEAPRDAVERLLAQVDIRGVVEDSSLQISNSWTAGTSRKQVLDAIAELGGYLAPWFDNSGTFRCIRQFDPEAGSANFDFDAQQTVIADSVTRSDSLSYTPNRIVIVNNGGISYDGNNEGVDPGPIMAFCDVPSTAPHSIMNLGFVRPEVIERQVNSQAQAQAVADLLCLTQTVVETVELSTSIDPRHDGWNTVQFQGQRWLEQGWSMQCAAGGTMQHTLQRSYPASPEVLSGTAGAITVG